MLYWPCDIWGIDIADCRVSTHSSRTFQTQSRTHISSVLFDHHQSHVPGKSPDADRIVVPEHRALAATHAPEEGWQTIHSFQQPTMTSVAAPLTFPPVLVVCGAVGVDPCSCTMQDPCRLSDTAHGRLGKVAFAIWESLSRASAEHDVIGEFCELVFVRNA